MTFYLTSQNHYFALTEENGYCWTEQWTPELHWQSAEMPQNFTVLTYADLPEHAQLAQTFLDDLLEVVRHASRDQLSTVALIIQAYATGNRYTQGQPTEALAYNLTTRILERKLAESKSRELIAA